MRALLFLALPALLAASPAPETPLARGCGTAQVVQAWIDGGKPGGTGGPSARTAAAGLRAGRTLYTANFALHYSVNKSIHQIAWTPADSVLRRLRDSLYTAFLPADPNLRDSLLHGRLDSLNAPHPVYVQKAAAYFEKAHAYYADTLQMRMPDSNLSTHFGRPSLGRYSVDIVDIVGAQGSGFTETYGVTFPPEGSWAASMVIENDFKYNAVMNGDSVVGTPIRAVFNGSELHNYSVVWDSALAVTIPHEYYHAVQFEYTRGLLGAGYHAWYELSAVGMEERLAPEVNDYLQYLHHVIPHSGTVGLLSSPLTLRNYGNGIFHVYLSHVVGKEFDVAVWERLRSNTNKLPDALLTAFGSAARWDSLYTGYAASMALSGRPNAGASPLAFSPDMTVWPRPTFDSALAQPVSQATLSPLTFRLIRPTAAGSTWLSVPGMKGGWRMTESGTTYSAQYLADSILPVSAGAFAVTAVNASPTDSRLMKLSRSAAGISAYPNPARAGGASVGFAAPVPGSGATLTIVSESGRRVATLPQDASGTVWTWNLRDALDRAVPPGLYYYGIPGETPQTLLVLP